MLHSLSSILNPSLPGGGYGFRRTLFVTLSVQNFPLKRETQQRKAVEMVLPDHCGLREPSPERQSFYQAGNGNILDHFAGMTTPDVRGKLQSSDRGFTGRNATDRNGGNAANGTSDFALDRRSGNPATGSNGRANGGGGMESACGGISSRSNVENEPSREEQLMQWQRAKETGGSKTGGATEFPHSAAGASALSGPQSALRRSAGLRPSTAREGTQQGETLALDNQREGSTRNTVSVGVEGPSGSVRTAPPSYSMSFSPPHHLSTSSRRSTTESADSSAALPPPFGKSSTDAGKSSAYSPVAASVEFLMSRDLEEEDRAVESKSEREKAYLYKKVATTIELSVLA
ncbi:hypothetical protein BBJ28_00015372 [Nothophytophthora sp. Chile5]|nr:hypothetical protein BBJ28_00015372 [Nothophytophthora sp. Chile5]